MAPLPPSPATRGLVFMQRLAAVLLGVSIALLVWNHFGMARAIELADHSEIRRGPRSDDAEHGASHAELKRAGNDLVLDCTLKAGYAWPYCGAFFSPGMGPDGIDLSGFDTVTVDVAYTGPGPHVMRLSIRNFEPGFSNIDHFETQKVNEIEFDIPAHGPITIPLKLLRTAAWWNTTQHVPLLQRDTRIDHVTDVELYTGGETVMGQHRVVLKSVRFQGKAISQYRLLLLLAGVWITLGIAWLALGLVHYRDNLIASRQRLAVLSNINQALELEARELAGQVYVDALTGALNRQGLRNMLLKEFVTDDGDIVEFAVMFVDIDHFKRINDGHGHSVGDAVLRHFADMVKLEIRMSDRFVRWGGEEFLILCPNTDMRSANGLAEKLRVSMARQAWPAALRVTSSFGITVTNSAENFGTAIERADRALYRAKQNGRNRVEQEAPAVAETA